MILAALLLFACEAKAPVENTAPSAAPKAAPSPPPAPPATPTTETKLPDLSIGMPTGYCDNGPGGAGAASHFIGEFTINGDEISGRERWVLQANKKWKAAGGADCTIEWIVKGKRTTPTRCAGCSFGIQATGHRSPAVCIGA